MQHRGTTSIHNICIGSRRSCTARTCVAATSACVARHGDITLRDTCRCRVKRVSYVRGTSSYTTSISWSRCVLPANTFDGQFILALDSLMCSTYALTKTWITAGNSFKGKRNTDRKELLLWRDRRDVPTA